MNGCALDLTLIKRLMGLGNGLLLVVVKNWDKFNLLVNNSVYYKYCNINFRLRIKQRWPLYTWRQARGPSLWLNVLLKPELTWEVWMKSKWHHFTLHAWKEVLKLPNCFLRQVCNHLNIHFVLVALSSMLHCSWKKQTCSSSWLRLQSSQLNLVQFVFI